MGDNAAEKPKRTLLPVLTVLFLISYGLLTTLVMEQGRTIASQRGLIQSLFNDSAQLTGLKAKAIQKQQADARAQSKAQTQSKTPPAQGRGGDSQAKTSPSQAAPPAGAKNHNMSKFRRPLPQKPPKDTSDEMDVRRTLVSI